MEPRNDKLMLKFVGKVSVLKCQFVVIHIFNFNYRNYFMYKNQEFVELIYVYVYFPLKQKSKCLQRSQEQWISCVALTKSLAVS